MYRTILTVAAVAPLARGDYSYSYDAPTMAPTTSTMTPTASLAPTRSETYAPSRVTEAPSYAPTTDTYAPTLGACPLTSRPKLLGEKKLLAPSPLPLSSISTRKLSVATA